MKISKRWLQVAEMYVRFAKPWAHMLDFSEAAKLAQYVAESRGGKVTANNGYAVGKRWMDVTLTMWREDIASGLLRREELEQDFPKSFLALVLRA